MTIVCAPRVEQTFTLIGLKGDLRTPNQQMKISRTEIDAFCDKFTMNYYKISSKTNPEGVMKMFKDVVKIHLDLMSLSKSLRDPTNISIICHNWTRKTQINWLNVLSNVVHKFVWLKPKIF